MEESEMKILDKVAVYYFIDAFYLFLMTYQFFGEACRLLADTELQNLKYKERVSLVHLEQNNKPILDPQNQNVLKVSCP